jgi:hypothetical protein|tara:strand:+ start:197 stop:337 length:141 start_codon:yes stop_codon:yes gene_type:complete
MSSETKKREAIDRMAVRIKNQTRGKTDFNKAREIARKSMIRLDRKK